MLGRLVTAVLCAAFGLVASPVLLVAMQRAPIRERYRAAALHCMTCGDAVQRVQRVPWLAKIKKQSLCQTCKSSISSDTPWFDFVTVGSLTAVGALIGFHLEVLAYVVFVACLIAITVVDLRHYVIPNRIVYPSLFACMALLVVPAILGDPHRYLQALAGMAASWLFFFVVYLINPRGLGFGDVRLSALIGFMAGWLGLGNAFLAVFLGLLLGAVVGIFLMIFRIRGRKEAIPYGPFLALGSLLAIFGPLFSALF